MTFLTQPEENETTAPARNRDGVLLIDLRETFGFLYLSADALNLYVFPDADTSIIIDRVDRRAPFRVCIGLDALNRAAPLWAGLAARRHAEAVRVLSAWWSVDECKTLTTALAMLREVLENA